MNLFRFLSFRPGNFRLVSRRCSISWFRGTRGKDARTGMRALMHRDFGARDLGPAAMAAAIPRPPLSGSRNTWCRSPAAASSELNACSRPRPVPKLGQPRHPQAPAYGRPVQKHKRTQDWRAGPFRFVIDPWRAPDLGRVGGDVGDSGSPYAQGKHRPATGCHAPGRRPGSRPGLHLDQNVLAGYAVVALGLDSGPLGRSLFRRCTALFSDPLPPLAQTWHSKIEIRDQNRK